MNLDPWNLVASLGIAFTETLLIAIYFMHLRYSSPLPRLVAAGARRAIIPSR
jgi:caa(3)-type oxidase subunit IV